MNPSAPNVRPLRILLMGDASNYHRCLAVGLRRMGHDVTVASDGSRWMDTGRDIDITRHPGRIGGLMFWLNLRRRRRLFTGFDIVQLVGPGFISQRPGRIMQFFDFLRDNNGRVFMTMLGTDPFYIDMCLASDSPLRYNEWCVGHHPSPLAVADAAQLAAWHDPELRRSTEHIYANVDGIATALYEYDLTVHRAAPQQNTVYTGIPVDTASMQPVQLPGHFDTVRLFMGAHSYRMIEKGTDRILDAARRVAARYPERCVIDTVSDLPYAQYVARMLQAHVVMDQLYSYTPATNALLAMAAGIPVLSGGEEEFYDFIGERSLRPVINAVPDDAILEHIIEQVIIDPDDLRRRAAEGLSFVARHNDVSVVAERFLKLWGV